MSTPVTCNDLAAHRSAMMLTAAMAIDYPSTVSAQGLREAVIINDRYLAVVETVLQVCDELKQFIESAGERQTSNEVGDFITNNADDLLARAENALTGWSKAGAP